MPNRSTSIDFDSYPIRTAFRAAIRTAMNQGGMATLRFVALLVSATLLAGCSQPQQNSQSTGGSGTNQSAPSDLAAGGSADAASAAGDSNDADPRQTKEETEAESSFAENEKKIEEVHTIEIPSHWKRFGKHEIWVDFAKKEVIVSGYVCLNIGPLEMFICPMRTKEHESVIAVNAEAKEVHALLILLGFDAGAACEWQPEYLPAVGPEINVDVMWHDDEKDEVITRSAKSMIKNSKTRKPMETKWVFGGSQMWTDPETKESIYYGDSGELICLSNFSTATIDLAVESSSENGALLFEAFTENIPPIGTKVYAVIKAGEFIGEKREKKPTVEEDPLDLPTDLSQSPLAKDDPETKTDASKENDTKNSTESNSGKSADKEDKAKDQDKDDSN